MDPLSAGHPPILLPIAFWYVDTMRVVRVREVPTRLGATGCAWIVALPVPHVGAAIADGRLASYQSMQEAKEATKLPPKG